MINSVTFEDAVAVTTSDGTNDPAGPFSGFYVGTSAPGDVKVRTERGNDVVFKNVIQGTVYNIRILRVWTTGTTASNILGLKSELSGRINA